MCACIKKVNNPSLKSGYPCSESLSKMANFLLATVSIYLFAFNTFIALTEASKKFHEKSSSYEKQSGSPCKKFLGKSASFKKQSHRPAWFKPSEGVKSPDTWNMFGQWFNQNTSLASREYVNLCEITDSCDFWDFISAREINDLDRIDLSIFRPGLEPNFSDFVSHKTGYILSYKIKYEMMNSPGKLSRNEAKKLKDAGNLGIDLFPHYHVFDPLIDAVLRSGESEGGKSSGSSVCGIDDLTSEIMGFIFKRQYLFTFVQIFIEGVSCPDAGIVEAEIEALLTSAFPEIELPRPRRYKLDHYSHKIASRSPISASSKSPSRLSPKKITSQFSRSADEIVQNFEENGTLKLNLDEEPSSSGEEEDYSGKDDSDSKEFICNSINSSTQDQDAEESSIEEIVLNGNVGKLIHTSQFSPDQAQISLSVTGDEDSSNVDHKLNSDGTLDQSSKLDTKPITSIPTLNSEMPPLIKVEDLIFDRIFSEDLNLNSMRFVEVKDHFVRILDEIMENRRK